MIQDLIQDLNYTSEVLIHTSSCFPLITNTLLQVGTYLIALRGVAQRQPALLGKG